MEIEIINLVDKSSTTKVISAPDAVFGCEFNEPLVHQVVTSYLTTGRSGNHAQKSRSEVRGGGRKPWRQKGTGQARAGTIRSPIWRGGGVTFAAKPTDYSQKINKKMYRNALCAIFSELIRQGRLIAVESLELVGNKTKDFVKILQSIGVSDALLVADEVSKNLYLASRNLFSVKVCDINNIDPVSLIKFNKVIVTFSVLEKLAERLS